MRDGSHAPSSRRVAWLSVAAVVASAAFLRLPALLTDFWFDEILNYEQYARIARSAIDIFFAPALKHDNNHHLNTLALYWLGEQRNWVVYRLPSAVAGLAAVAGAVVIGQRRSRLEGALTGLLVGGSFMAAVYSSEARGYGAVLAAAVFGFLALDRFLTSGSGRALFGFWLAVAAGLASHSTILHFYIGALFWSGFRLRTRRRDLLRLHAGPVLWMVVWAVSVVRGSVVGGGPPWTWAEILDRTLAWTFGYPIATVPAAAAATALMGLIVWDARHRWATGSDEGLFYIGTIVGPPLYLAALAPPYLFPRYFLVPMLFALVVAGAALARLWRGGTVSRSVAIGLVALFLTGNGVSIVEFARTRTGQYPAAVRRIADTRLAGPVVVTSPSLDQWSEVPIRFYARALGLGAHIRYLPRADVARRSPDLPVIDWVLEPEEPCDPDPESPLTLSNGEVFVREEAYRMCGPSGMSWFLYAKAR